MRSSGWRYAGVPLSYRVMTHHEGTKNTKDTKTSNLELSHEVIGAAIEVHRQLGPGLLESVYELALCKELWLRHIVVERQVNLPIVYKGSALECSLKLDLLVDHRVVVEVKSVDKITNIQKAQVLTYLRLRQLWLGLIERLMTFFVVFVSFVPSW